MTSNGGYGISKALSSARLSPYLAARNGDEAAALQLYGWNVQISTAFYPLLGLAEVGLRNAMHDELGDWFHRSDWWVAAPLVDNGQRLVKRAQQKADGGNADDVVAQLNLGFWVSLISRSYDRSLWVPSLHKAFPLYRGRRDRLHVDLTALLKLRNRVMHHESIYQRDLRADHAALYRVCGYISTDLVMAMRSMDSVPQVLERREQ